MENNSLIKFIILNNVFIFYIDYVEINNKKLLILLILLIILTLLLKY